MQFRTGNRRNNHSIIAINNNQGITTFYNAHNMFIRTVNELRNFRIATRATESQTNFCNFCLNVIGTDNTICGNCRIIMRGDSQPGKLKFMYQ